MKKLNLNFSLIIGLLFIISFSLAQTPSESDSLQKIAVNEFIEDWHNNAAKADLAYFDKISDNGIYIGTDATELWTKDEFVIWSEKYFERGKAWTFTTIERNIYLSDDTDLAWFDELLNTGMGVCRASGIIQYKDDKWEILHYHLSLAVPNESIEEVKKAIGSMD